MTRKARRDPVLTRSVLALVLLLCGALGVWFYARRGVEPEAPRAWERLREQQAEAGAAAEPRPPTRVSALTAGGRGLDLRIAVHDSGGAAVEGATVSLAQRLTRLHDPGEEVPLGSTDGSGVLTLTRGRDDPDIAGYICVRGEGYVAGFVEAPEWGQDAEVVLQKECRFDGRAVDPDGRGVAGVCVYMSQTPLAGGSFPPAGVPGPIATEAVFRGVTSADGHCSIGGMANGVYDIRVLHPEYAWVDDTGVFARPGVRLPWASGEVPELRMRPLMGVNARFVGADVLARRFTYSSRDPGFWHWGVVVKAAAARARANDVCFAMGVAGSLPDVLPVEVYVDREGWRTIDLRTRRLSLESKPVEVHVDAASPGGLPAASVKVSIVDAGGATLPVGHLRLVGQTERGSFSVHLDEHGAGRVPRGVYRLDSAHVFVQHEAGHREVVVDDGHEDVVIHADLAPCRWRFVAAHEREIADVVHVRVHGSDGREEMMMVESGQVSILPTGTLSIEAMSPLRASRRIDVVVVGGRSEPEVIECRLH